MELRSYQRRVLDDIHGEIRRGKRSILAVCPTGSGKTVMASFLANDFSSAGDDVWFLCHRGFLIEQTARTFDKKGLQYGKLIASQRRTVSFPVMIASVDTLKARLDQFGPPRIMVWDEAHHCLAGGWLKIMRDWADAQRDVIHIGLTATPERLDGRGLGEVFQTMVIGPTVAELMEKGSLSKYRAFAPSLLDTSNLHRGADGDYDMKEVEEMMRQSMIMGDIVSTYQNYARGMRMVYFAPSVAYSEDLAAQFNVNGVRARHIDGTTPEKDRVAAAVAFAAGELDVLTNCMLFGEGFDLGACAGRDDVTIEGVGLVRPTASLALHFQMVGRALRPKPKPALILDHAGNLHRHGLPDREIDWTLDSKRKRSSSGQGPSLVKTCQGCGASVSPTCEQCPHCGYAFEAKVRDGPIHVNDVLLEISEEQRAAMNRKKARDRLSRCVTKQDFVNLAMELGYKPYWGVLKWREAQDKVEAQAAAYLRDYNPRQAAE